MTMTVDEARQVVAHSRKREFGPQMLTNLQEARKVLLDAGEDAQGARIIPDEVREQATLEMRAGGRPTPPDLKALREGKTVFWPDGLWQRRVGAIQPNLPRGTRLVRIAHIQDGVSGRAGWFESD